MDMKEEQRAALEVHTRQDIRMSEQLLTFSVIQCNVALLTSFL